MTNQNLAGTQDLALGSFEVNQVQAFLPFAGGNTEVSFFGGQVGGINRLTQSVLNHDFTVLPSGAYIQNFFTGVGVNRQQVVLYRSPDPPLSPVWVIGIIAKGKINIPKSQPHYLYGC